MGYAALDAGPTFHSKMRRKERKKNGRLQSPAAGAGQPRGARVCQLSARFAQRHQAGDSAVGSSPGSAETHPPPPPPHRCPSLACSPSGKPETPGRRPTLSCGRESGEGEEGGGGGRKGGGRTPGDARAAVQPAAGHH